MKGKNEFGKPNYKTSRHSKAIVIKAVGGTAKRLDKHINGTEKRDPKWTHTNTVNRSLMKEQRQFNGEKTVFSTNGARTTSTLKTYIDRYKLYTFHKN